LVSIWARKVYRRVLGGAGNPEPRAVHHNIHPRHGFHHPADAFVVVYVHFHRVDAARADFARFFLTASRNADHVTARSGKRFGAGKP
jgi:hypothetical protein